MKCYTKAYCEISEYLSVLGTPFFCSTTETMTSAIGEILVRGEQSPSSRFFPSLVLSWPELRLTAEAVLPRTQGSPVLLTQVSGLTRVL